MIQKIGKYQVRERIGRGGMGTVFKAHDPVLDRSVALKVISPDIEVTDALRTRFFREAQACARLNHRNIITVYDLAEVDGHLFIVMELLEGEELKTIIGQRKPLSLEAKLGIMIQVCDGLAYAHQRGIVHRDIKPGNIFVLRDGSVKIVDFGIARIIDSDSDLTRKGLVMGTLRYMAPEQAQGSVDQRCDVFSVGAVFYELLVYRQAFPGDDPMQILEALRSHPPPPLHEVDPAIPAELGQVVAGALTRDPQQRFAELVTVRRELDGIRRRLLDESSRLRVTLESSLAEAQRLHAEVVEQAGCGHAQVRPALADHADLAALRLLEQELPATIERYRRVLADAKALEPQVARGVELLRQGELESAARELESVVKVLPQHGRASDALRQVRDRLDEARQRERARVDTLRAQASEARGEAEKAGAAGDSAAAWGTAELMLREADASIEDESYQRAAERLEAATQLYRRAADEARETARRRARASVEAARHEVVGAREVAAGLEAPVTAAEPWGVAVAHEARASAAVERLEFTNALEHLAAARRQYDHAADLARADLRRREREAVEDARNRVMQLQRVAQELQSLELAPTAAMAAESAHASGDAALARQDYRGAAERFEVAQREYRRAIDESRAALQGRRRQAAESSRARTATAREQAEQVRAHTLAAERWRFAEDKQREGDIALQRGDLTGAQALFADAGRAFEAAAEIAREQIQRVREAPPRAPFDATRGMPVDDATRLAPPPARHRKVAPDGGGPAAEKTSRPVPARGPDRRRATIAVAAAAIVASIVGLVLVWAPWRSSPLLPGVKGEPESVGVLQQRVVNARKEAEQAGARERSIDILQQAMTAESRGDTAKAARDWSQAEARYLDALQSYQEAAAAAGRQRELDSAGDADRERLKRLLADAESAGAAASTARQRAEQAGAQQYADRVFASAEQQERGGRAALTGRDFGAARDRFAAAEKAYLASAAEARKAKDAEAQRLKDQKADAERAAEAERERARSAQLAAVERQRQAETEVRREIERVQRDFAPHREQALKSEADVLAKDVFDAAAAKQKEAERFAGALDVAGARQAYGDAGKRYDEARQAAVAVAGARTEADRERSRMDSAKGQADSASPIYADGRRQEDNGLAAYRRLAFKDAGVNFRASADLYARAVPSPTPPSPPAIAPTPPPREGPIAPFAPNSAEAEIKTVLEQLKRAFATKDVAMVQRLRPGMSDEALRRLRETFDNARSYELELRVEALKIAGNEAQARTFRRDLMTAKDGQIHQSETTVTVVLKREAGGWRITDIK